jgi:polyphosphate kinase
MRDNTQAWTLQKDGSYVKQAPIANEPPYSVQQDLLEKLANKS